MSWDTVVKHTDFSIPQLQVIKFADIDAIRKEIEDLLEAPVN